MVDKRLKPARLVPIAQILTEEIHARGWTIQQFAEELDLDEQLAQGLFFGAYRMHPDLADRVGKAFGTSGEMWTNFFRPYDED